MTARSRLSNGRYKKTNYFTRSWFDWTVLGCVFFLTTSCAITLELNNDFPDVTIAKAVEPPVEVAVEKSNDATLAEQQFIASESATSTPAPIYTVDEMSQYISEAVQEFLPTHKSEALMLMHCLAHRENGHAGNPNGFGDGGLAGGPYQFHQATWERMRKQMIAQGVAEDMSSRMDLKESTRTTAWAIANGRAREWGPVYRDSKGSTFASCQTPSWYK